MKIKIWGTRGSIPSPLTSQAIREKLIVAVQGAKQVDHDDPMAVRAYVDALPTYINGTVGGNTSCIELRADNQLIIVDAGSGIRALGQELMAGPCGHGQGVVHLFLSHTHWDHIQGFPFFMPAFVRGNRINIYSVHDVAPTLAAQMKPATFPISLDFLPATIQFTRLTEGQKFTIGNIHISNMGLPHPGENYAYRFEYGGAVCVYASDAEYTRLDEAHLQPYVRFFAGADVLIFDAQFTLRDLVDLKKDWGHSSPMIGADLSRQAGVRRLVLFHHDPASSDQDIHKMLEQTLDYLAEQEADATCEIIIGSEGTEIDLSPNLPCSLRRLPDDKAIILRLVGELDERVVAELERELAEFSSELPSSLPSLIVDMEGTTRLSIAGLRALIDLRRHWGGDALVLCGLSSHVRRVIELANYLDFFAIYPSLQAALAALEAREMLRLPGQLLKDRYRIEAKVGESEKGIVLQATDTRLERPVAIKVLSSSYNQQATERFMVQAQQMARLNAPNVVALYDCDEEQGLVYLVMEYVPGKTLRQLMDEVGGGQGAALPILDIAIHILHALEYAHSRGVVHGNLRPENVLISDTVKLSDFGLRWIEQGRRLTEIPMLVHHPDYLAPEQIRGAAVESRTDLYAFGVMLYEFFTGRRPFEGDPAQVLDQHLHQPPIPPRQLNPDLSRSLDFLIMKLLTKEPEQRYSTATQVAQVLARLEHTPMAGQGHGEGAMELAAPQRRVRLVGRDVQLRRLSKSWELARSGQGQVLLIAGEAGVGKTRLAEELAAQIEDGIVLIGTCGESEGNVPYQPFIEVGRGYLERTPLLELRDKLGDSAPVVATLVPELHDLMPNLPALVPLNTEHERLRLMHGFTQFVARATVNEPWLLFLDDLHWADPASLHLLHYLARNLGTMRLLIVGTYRDVELEPEHPLQELLRGLARYPAYQHMELSRLDRDGVRQLLESMWRQEVPDEWITAIFQRTGGNPFYVEEVVKEVTEEGLITLRDGHWHFAPLVELKLPQRVRDLVLRRVGRLNPATQDVLRLAAVLGQSFSFSDLLAVVDQPEERLLESLDELLERDMIREGEGGATLGFSHVEIHQVIYEELNLLRRRVLHRRVGTLMEQIHADRLDAIAGQLAHHFFQAGDQEKSFAYSLQMAKQARSLHAFQSALSWYTRAASVVPEEESYLARRSELYEGLGEMLQTQSRYGEAIDSFRAMQLAAETMEDVVAQARAWNHLSEVQERQGEYRASLVSATHAERLIRTVEAFEETLPTTAQRELARALVRKGWTLYRLGKAAAALAMGEQALHLSNELGKDDLQGQALAMNLLGVIQRRLGRYQQAQHYQERALALYRTLGEREREAMVLNTLGVNAQAVGDYPKAIELCEQALTIHREIGNRQGEMLALSNLSGAQVGMKDYATAESTLRQTIRLPESTGWFLALSYRYLAEACLGLGKLPEAREAALRSLELAQETGEQVYTGMAWRTLGMVLAHPNSHGEEASAAMSPTACFAASHDIFMEMGGEGERARTLREWARYELAQGEPMRGKVLWRDARALFERLGMEREAQVMHSEEEQQL